MLFGHLGEGSSDAMAKVADDYVAKIRADFAKAKAQFYATVAATAETRLMDSFSKWPSIIDNWASRLRDAAFRGKKDNGVPYSMQDWMNDGAYYVKSAFQDARLVYDASDLNSFMTQAKEAWNEPFKAAGEMVDRNKSALLAGTAGLVAAGVGVLALFLWSRKPTVVVASGASLKGCDCASTHRKRSHRRS